MIKPKKSIEDMNGYNVPLFEKDWDIKIDSNENNYGPSNKVIAALNNVEIKKISFYPYYGEISQKIADITGFNINNIKVTNGADEAIQSIIQTYLEKNEKLITLDCSFEMPVIYSQIQGGEVIKVPFEEKWTFPVNSFIKKLSDESIKIVYLAVPNNPTGNIIDEKDLRRIIETAKNKIIIIDETYANYSNITYNKFVKEYDNVFSVHSMSKDYALAGLRLGYIISNEENINTLKKVISPYSVNAYAITAGLAALSDIDYFYKVRDEVNLSKEELTKLFSDLGAVVYKSYANFLLVDFKEKAEFVFNLLKKENIIVKFYKSHPVLKNHLRITVPTKTGIERIKQALKIKPALVFDMDGVLVDAGNSYRATIQKTYEQLTGKSITPQEIQDAKNLGGLNNDWDLTKYLLNKSGFEVSYEKITEIFQQIYWNDGKGLINNENHLFNKELFNELSKDYQLAIFTGRLREEALYALERFNSKELFYPIITTDDIPFGKGKPDSYGLNLMKDLTYASEYYYFGDTKDDITAAKNAGYKAIGVLPPQDKSDWLKDNLKSNGADYILNSVNDIKTILEKEKNNERVH